MTDVPLREHLEVRLKDLERQVDKSEGSVLDRLDKLEQEVGSLRRWRAHYAGQIALLSAILSTIVSALVAWIISSGWAG